MLQVTEWTTQLATTGDEFYVYVHTEVRFREADYRETLNRGDVVIVPLVGLRDDKTVRETTVGHSDDIAAAIESLRDSIDTDGLWTGSYSHLQQGT